MNISWEEYFMGVAQLSSLRSKDPHTKVGACIVGTDNKIKSCGYNGFPKLVYENDDRLPWNREGDWLKTKYPYVAHAELNAILNARERLDNCILYVTLFPCNECAKAIIQAGIKSIVYLEDTKHGSDEAAAAREMFHLADINLYKYKARVLVPEFRERN